jgi:hypothetical protein
LKKKQLILALFAILLLSFIPQNLNLFLNSSSIVSADTPTPAWLDPAWSYRRPITIDNTLNPNALSNYQLNVNVTYVSSMKSNFDDLRFTTSDGQTLIPYWIETSNPSQSASVWVNVPAVAASAVTTIYMYYGNPNAPAYSNGQNTFDFFDTFESLGLGLSSWTYKAPIPINTADPTAAVYNGKLYVFGGYQNTATDVLGITYEYNPATDTWTKKANMPTPRWGEVAVTYNDQIYVFGGQTANLTNSTVSIPAATLVTLLRVTSPSPPNTQTTPCRLFRSMELAVASTQMSFTSPREKTATNTG